MIDDVRSMVRSIARWAGVRALVEREFSRLHLFLDTRSDSAYQPIEGLPGQATRAVGTASRWSAMAPIIAEFQPRTALDIGANYGWFVSQLATLKISTVGVERYPPYYRTALYHLAATGLQNAGILVMGIDEETVSILPDADCVLVLSVWHHFVKEQGIARASYLLSEIWNRTRQVLFFDTGESAEMDSSFRLPDMRPDARTWLEAYLKDTCTGSDVRHLGCHESGDSVYRNLFAIVRVAPTLM